MTSPITEPDRSRDTINIHALSRGQGNTGWTTSDPCVIKVTLIGDIDENQFQPNNNDRENEQRALQGSNADRELSVQEGEAPQRHHLSTYTDDEKRWLVIAADEERNRGTGFMLGLKRRWDQCYPQRKHVSKQNLRDNAARFQKEIMINDSTESIQDEHEQDTILNDNFQWTNEMKINLLKIEEHERN